MITLDPTEATQTYDLAVDRLVRYHPDVVRGHDVARRGQPDFAMGHALAAYLSLTSTDVPDLDGARERRRRCRAGRAPTQEQAHATP